MRETTLVLTELHDKQQEIIAGAKRYNVIICGRRFGKTQLLTDVGVNGMIDGEKIAYFTPTYRMGSEVWRSVVSTIQPITSKINNSERRIETLTGGLFEAWSLTGGTSQSVRGRFYDKVIIDEAAFIRDPTLWDETIRPLLTDLRGGAWFATTPKGRNWVYRLYTYGIDPAFPEWQSFRFPTTANPYIPAEEIEEIRRTMVERSFQQEYEAKFLDDVGAVFRGVDNASTIKPSNPQEGVHAIEPSEDMEIVGGLDWGRSNDFTVLTFTDRKTGRQVYSDRFNQVGWQIQRDRVLQACQIYKPVVVWAESNSIGSVNIEALQADGLPVRSFETTAKTKSPLIEGLALAIERKDVELFDVEIQKAELLSYSLDRMPGGAWKYSAPPGMHDDYVVSLALSWYGVAYQPASRIVTLD